MRKIYFICISCLITSLSFSQIVTLDPQVVDPDQELTLIFDAALGNAELIGADKIYMHHGLVTDSPDGTDWSYVVGNWGQDDGVGEMAPVSGEPNKWQINFTPSLRDYFAVPSIENIFRIAAVFRSADGSIKGTTSEGSYGWGEVSSNLDFYIDLDVSNYISFSSPLASDIFLQPGENFSIDAFTSSLATEIKLFIDEGSGYAEVANVNSNTSISYDYSPNSTSSVGIRATAIVNGEMVESEKQLNIVVVQATPIVSLPLALEAGINYNPLDDTKATLVLQAPGKTFGYVVGDMTNWNVQDDHQMNQTPDGIYLWRELDNLTPSQAYVFQYWVDGEVKIGDPYAEQAADPWNDHNILASTYPNVPLYDKQGYGYATVLETGQDEFLWPASESSWQKPDVNHLIIYELLVRDFIGTHSYVELKDTLDYLQTLGINAIELMPVHEFEGNESWGYNPAYYFAPDKYYGTRDQLKAFIAEAHARGIAVIFDAVLNHSFGQNPMLKLYFDEAANKPALDNPWFNREYVGQYQWGYDFDHESTLTQEFVDRHNAYWMNEYHFDGFRFDFTKGMTNYAPGGNVDGFDQSRIDILKRMADEIWAIDSEAYIILEHWGTAAEEEELSDYGMKLWRNRSYDYVPAITGNTSSGDFSGMAAQTHISFFDSHDEQRIAYHTLTEGLSDGSYNIKDPIIMFERVKMTAAFAFLYPGPKMMWQFDELGYDIDINYDGRLGNKPLPWGPDGLGYYEDPLRQHIYSAYQGIIDVRNQISPEILANAIQDHKSNGATRRISLDGTEIDLSLIGNFGFAEEAIEPRFSQTGYWYDYFSGDSILVSDVNEVISLEIGEWHIYTSERLSEGLPGVVEVYSNPVSISPNPFTKSTEITITFDASKAWPNGTDGLENASKVYMHSGIIKASPDSSTLENVVGTFLDDGIGEMTSIGNNLWTLTITPEDYYDINGDESIYKIGMHFRDENNVEKGYGFRDQIIFASVMQDGPIVWIEPSGFATDESITVYFDASQGNAELLGAEKVYMHSGLEFDGNTSPWLTGWQNVAGNWGADNGPGEMSLVPGESSLWAISLTPNMYYTVPSSQEISWICAVFRNADGSIKGTGNPGLMDNGIIHTNQDYFIRNAATVDVTILDEIESNVYPNPFTNYLNIDLLNSEKGALIEIFDISGRIVYQKKSNHNSTLRIDTEELLTGLYLLKISSDSTYKVEEIFKN